ncbi:MAG TPA: polysaccharide pyruvyl transferase family protein [Burkholderiales bacterium]|nr:polysaccharide pyruvyl transferase family protein [Burkholderiales bacterium]
MSDSLRASAVMAGAACAPLAAPDVAAFGEWDTANLGDRAIHAGVLRFFGECGWNVRSYGFSSLAAVPPDTALADAPPARSSPVRAILGGAPALKRALRGARQRVRMAGLAPALGPSQAVLVGGGALLTDINLHFPQSLVELARTTRRLNKPLLCLGCSVEGDWSPRGEAMIAEFLSACTMVAVRDLATAERLAPLLGAPPPVFGDFCLSEAVLPGTRERGGERRALAVNVCQLASPWAVVQERYEEAAAGMIRGLARSAVNRGGIRIFTTGLPEDARAAGRVHAQVGSARVELHLPRNLGQLVAVLGTSAVAVATRLHAAILALAERVPVVGFSATPKLRNFLATVGIEQRFHDLGGWRGLGDWLAGADCEALLAEQDRALARAPLWAGRANVRRQLERIARS